MPHKRLNGEGSVRQRKNGLWEVRYYLHDENGNLQRHSAYAPTAEKARDLLREHTGSAFEQTTTADRPKTVSQLADRYLAHFAKSANGMRPTSWQTNETRIRKYIKPGIGHVRLDRLSHEVINRFHDELRRRALERGEGFISESTVYGTYTTLAAMVRWGRQSRWMTRDPMALVTKPRKPEGGGRALTPDQVVAIIDVVRGKPDETLWTLAQQSGLRFGELAGLRWRDVERIDEPRAIVWVRSTVGRVSKRHLETLGLKEGLVVQPPKDWEIRGVQLTREATDTLRRHRAALGPEPGPDNHVFQTRNGGRLYSTWGNRRWHALQRLIGIPEDQQVRLHDTRSTSASLEIGAPPRITKERLGHSRAAQTWNYQQVLEQAPAVEVIEAKLAQARGRSRANVNTESIAELRRTLATAGLPDEVAEQIGRILVTIQVPAAG